MSILKKNTLAVALVAGLGIAGVASAYVTHTNADLTPEKVATADATDDSVTMTEDVEIKVNSTDLIVGRTTGFQVRLNLFGGGNGSSATFDGGVTGPFEGADLPAGWTVTLAAGGADGDNFAVFSVNPPSTNPVPGIEPGEIVNVAGLSLSSVEELLVEGGEIQGQTFFADPVTATELSGSRQTVRLLMSGNPIVLDCDSTAGDVDKRIDVADTSDAGGFEAKTAFSPDGSLGGANGAGTEADEFDFGDITAEVDPAFPGFTYAGTDEFTTTVIGDAASSFESFTSMYLSGDNCATSLVAGTIDGNEVTFEYTLADLGASGTAAGYTLALCGTVDNTDVIDDVNPVQVRTVFERPATDLTRTSTCSVLPVQYNGSVIEVYHINPAANPTAQTFLRVINRSSTGGVVRIEGIDDAGVSHGEISFVLPAQQSKQINSEDLENGNAGKGLTGAWGDGAGKWRAIVTAEFAGARVQALSRNTIDDTVTNLTDADGQGEQLLNSIGDDGTL